MNTLYLVLFIGILFSTTLWQAKEIGMQSGEIKALNLAITHKDEIDELKQGFQLVLDTQKQDTGTEIEGLKNDLIEQAVNFEDRGLSDPVDLGDTQSNWLNDWMQRNGQEYGSNNQGQDLSTTDAEQADTTRN